MQNEAIEKRSHVGDIETQEMAGIKVSCGICSDETFDFSCTRYPFVVHSQQVSFSFTFLLLLYCFYFFKSRRVIRRVLLLLLLLANEGGRLVSPRLEEFIYTQSSDI